MVICGVSFFRLSSLIQSLFWLAMLRCKTHICSKNIGKGIVLTQPAPIQPISLLEIVPPVNALSVRWEGCGLRGLVGEECCVG